MLLLAHIVEKCLCYNEALSLAELAVFKIHSVTTVKWTARDCRLINIVILKTKVSHCRQASIKTHSKNYGQPTLRLKFLHLHIFLFLFFSIKTCIISHTVANLKPLF